MRPPAMPTSARTARRPVPSTTVPPRIASSASAVTARRARRDVESVETCAGSLARSVPPRRAPTSASRRRDDLAAARERRFGVRVVTPPRRRVGADDVEQPQRVRVLLERREHVASEEVARQHVGIGETSPFRPPPRAVGVGVVEPVEEERDPRELVLDRPDAEAGEALEHAGEDEVGERLAHLRVGVHEHRRRHVLHVEAKGGRTDSRVGTIGGDVQRQAARRDPARRPRNGRSRATGTAATAAARP